jgi:hypothetical protein
METEAEAARDGSACGVAMICTVAGDGGTAGAAYTPPGEIVPHCAPTQPVPATLQEITRLGFEFAGTANAAVKSAVLSAVTVEGPVTARENALVTVIVAAPLLDGSATLVATRETVGGAI